jgi:hypothetical protein
MRHARPHFEFDVAPPAARDFSDAAISEGPVAIEGRVFPPEPGGRPLCSVCEKRIKA